MDRQFRAVEGRDPTFEERQEAIEKWKQEIIPRRCAHCGGRHPVWRHWILHRKGWSSPYCFEYNITVAWSRTIYCLECRRTHLSDYFCRDQLDELGPDSWNQEDQAHRGARGRQ